MPKYLNSLWMMAMILCVTSCDQLNKKAGLPNDNLLEEMVEKVIKQESGEEVDLTPEMENK